MSLRFSIVAEGNTDQAVIENILLGHFGQRIEKADIEWLFPPYIQKKGPHETQRGTWERVFQFLRSGDYRQALQFPGYLVVHIDTDVSTHQNFGVPHQEPTTGRSFAPEELVEAVRARLKNEIDPEDLPLVGHRLVFAIAVHQTPCWLIPLVVSDPKKAAAVTGCDHAVQRAISKKNLRREFGMKEVRAYGEISAPFRKSKMLRKAAKSQVSLALFLKDLGRVELEE